MTVVRLKIPRRKLRRLLSNKRNALILLVFLLSIIITSTSFFLHLLLLYHTLLAAFFWKIEKAGKSRLVIDKIILEQSDSCSIFCNVHIKCCWFFRKSWHCHHITCQSNDESSTSFWNKFTNCNIKAFWCSKKCWIIRKAILCFSHTYWQFIPTKLSKLFQLVFSFFTEDNFVTTVDFSNDFSDFFFK